MSYRILSVFLAVVCLFGSLIYLVNEKKSVIEEYNLYLSNARKRYEKEIFVDASAYYLHAYELMPSDTLALEIAEYYDNINAYQESEEWCESMLAAYPKSPAVYDYILNGYYETGDYASCFSLLFAMNDRKIHTELYSQILSEIKYEYFISNGYEEVRTYDGSCCIAGNHGKWGMLGKTGNPAVKLQYEDIGIIGDKQYIPVKTADSAFFIDANGNLKWKAQTFEPQAVGTVYNRIFPYYDGNVWYLYSMRTESQVSEMAFSMISTFYEGVAVGLSGDEWYIIDVSGAEPSITKSAYEGFIMDENKFAYKNGRLFANKNGVYHMIDKNGQEIGSQTFENARLFEDNDDESSSKVTYAAVKIGDKWGYVDKNNETVIEPQYDDARSFSGILAGVKKGDIWGFITKSGTMVIEPAFFDVRDMSSNGCVPVRMEDEWNILYLYYYNH